MTDICKCGLDVGFWVLSDTWLLQLWEKINVLISDYGTFFFFILPENYGEFFCKVQNERIQKEKPSC